VKRKTVALTVQPKQLQQHRAARLPEVRDVAYHDLREVIREVVWAEEQFQKRKYPVIDITGMTIEQVSARIVEALKLRE
jgi:regulator of PEP synthase PpsR (kinase-PPPase family)